MEYGNSNRRPLYNLIHVGGNVYPDTNCVAVVIIMQTDEEYGNQQKLYASLR